MEKVIVNKTTTKYTVNGKEYDSFESLPEDMKEFFKDENNNGIPDKFDRDFKGEKSEVKSMKKTKFIKVNNKFGFVGKMKEIWKVLRS